MLALAQLAKELTDMDEYWMNDGLRLRAGRLDPPTAVMTLNGIIVVGTAGKRCLDRNGPLR